MVIPLIVGSIVKELNDGHISLESHQILPLSVGFIAAFISGLLACTWMIKLVKKSNLSYFAVYCFIVGLSAIGYTFYSA
jgi:undecaprenyl-diphosphatase